MLEEQEHPIKVVSRRTGLTLHVIRVWEKRYRAVAPRRTPTNRRLYSDADIERLSLLHRATLAGRGIGHVARLSTKKLLALVADDEAMAAPPRRKLNPRIDHSLEQTLLRECLGAVERFDADVLEKTLARAAVTIGQTALLERVVAPLLHQIGERWRDGSLRVAQEHLASATVRGFLAGFPGAYSRSASASCLIVATPAGQMHELGACLVAVTAASEGWQVTYLGVNLPAEEIAGAARQRQAKAVALSVIYPADDPSLVQELRKLRGYLPADVVMIVGGRAAVGYREVLDAIGAIRLDTLTSLRTTLEMLRTQAVAP